jgi:hypothetical protein
MKPMLNGDYKPVHYGVIVEEDLYPGTTKSRVKKLKLKMN